MLNRIHQKLGTAGFIISIVALIAAVGGTAYAAGGLTKSQEKQVTKIAKKYAGKPGATGPAGAPGTPGAGKDGANGTNGAPGTSVTNTAVPISSATCNHLGGAEFKVGSGTPTITCNGETGFTETLPSEKTETGAWLATSNASKESNFAVSFPIPLSSALVGAGEEHAYLVSEAQVTGHTVPPGCTVEGTEGSAANPLAAPGKLCVYEGKPGGLDSGYIFNPAPAELGAGATGALVLAASELANETYFGTWAVTAE